MVSFSVVLIVAYLATFSMVPAKTLGKCQSRRDAQGLHDRHIEELVVDPGVGREFGLLRRRYRRSPR